MHSVEDSFRERSVVWLSQLKHLRLELACSLWMFCVVMLCVALLSVLFSFRVHHFVGMGWLCSFLWLGVGLWRLEIHSQGVCLLCSGIGEKQHSLVLLVG